MCFAVQIEPDDVLTMSKDGFFQSLKISKISEDYAGKYKFEADGRKTEAMIVVEGLNLFNFLFLACNLSTRFIIFNNILKFTHYIIVPFFCRST